ncbi:energy transducer TonB [Flavobacterium sp. 3HN19-14]|uniref:energy transducer TonB n=1 Tax=Flavobacterium sp. 3HN19-14 TaxID=3448133 RepID=UPI003EE25BF6
MEKEKKYAGDKIEIFESVSLSKNFKTGLPEKETVISNEKPATQDFQDDKVYTESDERPEPKNGMAKFYEEFMKDFKVSPEIKGTARIYIQFIVEKDGAISNTKVLRDAGFNSGDEAVRVLKTTQWNPGKVNGKTVRVMFTLPISIVQQ